MTRKIKNFTMVIMLILLIFSLFFTINYFKILTNSNSNNNPSKIMTEKIPPNIEDDIREQENTQKSPNESFEEQSGRNSNKKEQHFEIPNDSNKINRPNDVKDYRNIKTNSPTLSLVYYILLGLESFLISLIIIYLIISKFNKKKMSEVFKIKDKIVIFILSSLFLAFGITLITSLITNCCTLTSSNQIEESSKKDKANLTENIVLEAGNIDLNKYDSDVTITESGTYIFSGTFKNSIIVNALDKDIEIVLNGVDIETENTAAIVGLSANVITINTVDGTENKLADGGNSEYDGCIFSNAELVFEGNGKLIVNGNQNEGEGIATEAKNITINSGTIMITSNDDGINAGGNGATITINGGNIYIDASGDGIDSNKNAIINGGTLFVMGSDIGGDAGIDTDEGFVINGGTVIALGSDMVEIPKESSKQTTMVFSLNEKIDKNTLVTLMRDDEVIVSFLASKSFKTIIISDDTLTNGNYTLLKDGTNTGILENGIFKNGKYTKGINIKINNEETFRVSKIINTFGNNR